MRVLALGGAGAVAQEATRDLACYSDFDDIVIGEIDVKAARALADEIGDPRLDVRRVDASDYDDLCRAVAGFDVVMNGLPFEFDLPVNQACVELGVPGCDLSSDDPQFALHAQAAAKGIAFIPGMGATPGITNVMVRRASKGLDKVDEIDVSFAAFRCLAPAPGLLATTLWEFTPGVEERQEVYFEDGRWHPAPPLTGARRARFHDVIGEQMVYLVPHDEAQTLPRSIPGVRRVAVRGCFPPQVMELMGALTRAGLLSDAPVDIDGRALTSHEAVRRLLWAAPSSRQNDVWAYGLVVEVQGVRNGQRVKVIARNRHPPPQAWGGPAAYYKNIGVPLSIGAQMLAHGEVTAVGVLPPEQAIPTDRFFEELRRRGIEIEETIASQE